MEAAGSARAPAPPRVARHALVREVSESIAQGLTTQDLGRPDPARARRQHREYVEALESLGIRVTTLEAIPELPDSHFVEDVAVLHRGTAVLTSPGAPERREEVDRIRDALRAQMRVVGLDGDGSAHVDGGDVLVSGNHVLVGLSSRTNRSGADRLRDRLREIDPSLSCHPIAFRGPLHLKSGLTDLRPGVFVGDPRMALDTPLPGGIVRWLPPEEGYGANVLAVNNAALVATSSPTARELARAEFETVISLDLSEFRKMDGSLTCLSLLW